MRWARSLLPTVFLLSALRSLFAGLTVSPEAIRPVLSRASAGGSELPWWTPVAVSLVFLSAALIYWWRHRPRRPTDEPGEPDLLEGTGFEAEDDPPSAAPESEERGSPPIPFGDLVRPAPSA